MDTEILSEQALVVAGVSKNAQTGMPKNMVPDPRWFDGDRMKFEN